MKSKVVLDAEQRSYLKQYLSKGKHSARSMRRAWALLLLAQGLKQKEVARQVGCSQASVINLLHRYGEMNQNVQGAISERPRSGQPPVVTPQVEAHITALACSPAPAGRREWTLRLLAERILELGLVPHLSYEAVRRVLKKK